MFFLDHWKNLLLLTSPIRILVNYLRYDTYPFLDSHTLFKGTVINQTDWMKATYMKIYIAGHGPEAWKVSGLAAWIWIEKTIIHMFVNSKNPYPFKKIKACYKLISNISFFHYWREYYSIIQWREKQLKQSKAQNNWSKYLLNQQIEVKWHSLQETGHYDEPCWIEVKRLIQILTHIQPYRYAH